MGEQISIIVLRSSQLQKRRALAVVRLLATLQLEIPVLRDRLGVLQQPVKRAELTAIGAVFLQWLLLEA
jgi:hypothetical protein